MELGLFPLGLVLLPSEQVPLHIFEPRYRELIGECIDDQTPFGFVYADDDGIREIGTTAVVVEVTERFDDGRLNIVVEGRDRFRLVELTQGRSFHTGWVEPVRDDHDPADPADAERALALFRRLAGLMGTDVELPAAGDPELSFALAGRFDFSTDLKQELLDALSERIRLRRLCEVLETVVATIERQREIAVRAQTNGSVRPPEA